MIVDSILKTGLTYRGLFNISLYAITLPWITKVLYKSIGIDNYINGFFFFIIYWSIATAYVYFAIKQIRKTELFSKDKSDDDFKVLETVEKVTEFTLD